MISIQIWDWSSLELDLAHSLNAKSSRSLCVGSVCGFMIPQTFDNSIP